VINAWARSREKIAPVRAEQILEWMQTLNDDDVQPDKYTFNTVIHAYAKAGGTEAAAKAQELLTKMHKMYHDGNRLAKPDTITYNVVINCWAKSGGKGAAGEAEKLLERMHALYERGDVDVKPNVVTYGAVIDAFAKSGERGAAARADTLLANMIRLHQSDPVKHADLMPNVSCHAVLDCVRVAAAAAVVSVRLTSRIQLTFSSFLLLCYRPMCSTPSSTAGPRVRSMMLHQRQKRCSLRWVVFMLPVCRA
jgi:Pentatricopeptide repeat domain